MDRLQHYVSYIVGTFLCFPIRCFHALPIATKEEKKQEFGGPVSSVRDLQGGIKQTQQNVKRSCGQSQRSARLKHNNVPALKRK